MRFDPLLERAKFRRQRDDIHALTGILQGLSNRVNSVLSEQPNMDDANQSLKDIILVVALGGIEGVNTLMGAVSSVPEHFADRMYYIQQILNTGTNKQFNKAEVQFLTSLLSPSLVLDVLPCHQAYLPMLQKVSNVTSTIYTAFVSPPVSTCLMETCQGAALSRPHPPIVVTIFTLINGPLPALKCSLRCNKCGMIYNYSTYGNKKKDGEQYYDVPRKYVEVSDVVYCERQLYSLYCSLG